MRPSLKARLTSSGSDLLDVLERDDSDPLSGELRCDCSITNFLRMSSCAFQYFLTVIGHKIVKTRYNLQKIYRLIYPRKTCSNLAFFWQEEIHEAQV